ncbi:MAG: aminotransferase class IV [Saprospiraceae bacterium]|nr:aminotransferase class IV [Saprospiraceae bacterium]
MLYSKIQVSTTSRSMNFNGELYDSHPAFPEISSRAMLYGDGLFESIRMFEGKLPFLHLHWERLLTGMNMLGFQTPAHWNLAFFEQEIKKTTIGNARIRFVVWRSPGGLYFPQDNQPNFLITATPLESNVFSWHENGLIIRLSERVRLPLDSFSGLKTLGATRYVVAAQEARAKGSDDVIVLNALGNVSEASGSNLLWIKNRSVFAPSATDGQVTGTFQKILYEVLRREGLSIVEKPSTFAELMDADEVMLTNAISGIRWVRILEGKEFTCENIYHFNKLTVNYLIEKLAVDKP